MLDADRIAKRVIKKLDSIGIQSKVSGKDSHTANLIKILVQEIIIGLKQDAEVRTTVQTVGGPTAQSGTGVGKIS